MAGYSRERRRPGKFQLVSAERQGFELQVIRTISFDEGMHLVRTERAECIEDVVDEATGQIGIIGFQLLIVQGAPQRYRGFPEPHAASLRERPRNSCTAMSKTEVEMITNLGGEFSGWSTGKLLRKLRQGWTSELKADQARVKLAAYPSTH